ncbi:MAG TPA: 4Fe-4S dicluster domain-containing protein [Candidatus Omnitrophica bacterium]|nr:MAG: hypothetical protein DRP61_02335 [Candidatus Omnitrophota bacterium]RKY35719.1 MAG: hypothetical protein DRP69_00460 [Candidatus Omnitrophota bacterium]RKY44590.1 MAG: hypothetical protein DRP80_01965 [Candidatus Omnitrophota bacterium]HEC69970.1 4Fe-4S dicluster domain-containing protein [Candidatus Omnitrophota bacterium]
MRLPKIREIITAVKALITKPYTTKFPFRPHIPFKSFRGKPYFDKDKCVGCSACVNVCPTGALSFKDIKTDSGFKRVLKIRWDICIECGQCQLNCLTSEGIVLSNEYDLSATEERKSLFQEIEKALVCCEVCGKPVACIDHYRWVINKLGPLYVSNTSLISFKQKEIFIAETLPKSTPEILRSDRFRILCPVCRREAVFTS